MLLTGVGLEHNINIVHTLRYMHMQVCTYNCNYNTGPAELVWQVRLSSDHF